MPIIPINKLKLGTVTHTELLGKNGETLIKKDVELTEGLVSALVRRGVREVYTQEEEDEIKQILSTKIEEMEDLYIEDPAAHETAAVPVPPPPPPRAAPLKPETPAKALKNIAELRDLKKGKEGFQQILQSAKVREIETKIENPDNLPDKPAGKPLVETIVEKPVSERTEVYKKTIIESYSDALALTRTALESLREGGGADGKRIERLVESFVDTYINDHNILLNLSAIKSQTDDYLFNHCLNVCLLSINIAAAAGYGRRQVVEVGMAALLHDIGMMIIPQNIRFKQGPLSEDEFYEVRKHPVLGLHLLEKVMNIPDSVSYVSYQVHEREDGSGYPKGRKGRFLHFYARIVMIADVYEALSSPRPFRGAYLPYRSVEFLLAFVRKGVFNADLVRAFIDYASLFPVGSLVRLSTNQIAKVIQSNGRHHTRPVVSTLTDANGIPLSNGMIAQIDLNKQREVRVIQAVTDEKAIFEIMKGF